LNIRSIFILKIKNLEPLSFNYPFQVLHSIHPFHRFQAFL